MPGLYGKHIESLLPFLCHMGNSQVLEKYYNKKMIYKGNFYILALQLLLKFWPYNETVRDSPRLLGRLKS